MIRPAFSLVAAEEALKALDVIGDKRGKNWKRKAFMDAGKQAFLPILNGSVRLAPARTGLTRAALDHTTPIYNGNMDRILTPKGKVRPKAKNEYHIATTINKSFTNQFPLDSDGKRIRYPFIQEVGVETGTYIRKGYFRSDGTRVRTHKYDRKAARKPLLFMHNSLHSNADLAVSKWASVVDKHLIAATKTLYRTSKAAIAAVERRAATGRYTPTKWK